MHQISPEGIAFLKEKEGFRNDAYYDSANVLTIGYGHSAYAPSIEQYPVYEGQHITEEEGETRSCHSPSTWARVPLSRVMFSNSQTREIIRLPRMLCCNTRTLAENSSRGCTSAGKRKRLCIFLRFPKHKIQCGTMSGFSTMTGSSGKALKLPNRWRP